MLAIVIPYYKLFFFEETLKSLSSQTDKRFKVYIGNDASPENPSLLLEKYTGKFDFSYQSFQNNLGSISLSQHWDRCIAFTGDEKWIMILGDDDYLDKNIVKLWYENFDEFNNKTHIVRYATKRVGERNNNNTNFYTHPVLEKASDSYFRRVRGETRSSLSEYVFSKESYSKYGFKSYPLAWHSDDKAWLDFSDKKSIYSINESNVFVRISDFSISGKTDNEDLKHKASEDFYKDILIQNLDIFDKNQRLHLLFMYEVAIKKNRNLKLKDWLFLIKLYLKNFKIVPFFKCIRRFLISVK
ncbi:glycosyltransferase family A protein [Flavobacterium sp. C3NV]|uniref:glycosyltransferase family A protein n=1 Tax=Flavobacterium sp. C3NV TaxID=3393358 RepID=UPI00398F9136